MSATITTDRDSAATERVPLPLEAVVVPVAEYDRYDAGGGLAALAAQQHMLERRPSPPPGAPSLELLHLADVG